MSTYVVVEELAECDFGKFENRNYEELSGMPEYQAPVIRCPISRTGW